MTARPSETRQLLQWSANPVVDGLVLPQIAQLNALAAERATRGLPVTKLSGGDPQHVPQELREIMAACVSSDRADVFKYPPLLGVPVFRSAVAAFCESRYGEECTAENILATAGGCGGLTAVLRALVAEGEGVLIPDPCWEYLPSIVKLCGGSVIRYFHRQPDDSRHDWHIVARQIMDTVRGGLAKLVVFNYPLNPTGDIMPCELLAECVRECEALGVWCLFDDVTMDFQYGGRCAGRSEVQGPNCIFVRSFSKNFGLTGLRIGFIVAPPGQLNGVAKAQLYTSMYPCALAQNVLAQYLAMPEAPGVSFLDTVVSTFETKLEFAAKLLSKTPGIHAPMPDGGLFLFPRVIGIDHIDTHSLANETGVLVSSGLAFSQRCPASVRVFCGGSRSDFAAARDALQTLARLDPVAH